MTFRLKRSFGTSSLESISKFEKKFDVVLPEDYKVFLLEHNGGVLDPNGCFIKGPDQFVPIGLLFGLLEKKTRGFDLVHWAEEHLGDFPKGVVPIGGDCYANVIILGTSNAEHKGVFYYDGRPIFRETSEDGNTYQVSESFTEFMSNLVEYRPPDLEK